VSERFGNEHGNGRVHDEREGKPLIVLPELPDDRPYKARSFRRALCFATDTNAQAPTHLSNVALHDGTERRVCGTRVGRERLP